MELVNGYLEILGESPSLLPQNSTIEQTVEDRIEVDLGDLIERLKIQIDLKLGRR